MKEYPLWPTLQFIATASVVTTIGFLAGRYAIVKVQNWAALRAANNNNTPSGDVPAAE